MPPEASRFYQADNVVGGWFVFETFSGLVEMYFGVALREILGIDENELTYRSRKSSGRERSWIISRYLWSGCATMRDYLFKKKSTGLMCHQAPSDIILDALDYCPSIFHLSSYVRTALSSVGRMRLWLITYICLIHCPPFFGKFRQSFLTW